MNEIRIYAEWDTFGWIAKSVDWDGDKTNHHAGPRMAAEQLADNVFGKGNYKLRNAGYRLQYLAVRKEGK